MRLFFAVDVDRATRDAATRLRQRIIRAVPSADRELRWVHPDLLHLTLRFVGEVDDAGIVERACTEPVGRPRFVLQWGSPGWLPARRPRVFQIPVEAGALELGALADEVSRRLASVGIPAEDRPFTAHLTLARVRDGASPRLADTVAAELGTGRFAAGVSVEIADFVLYASRLSPRGPAYDVRLRIALRG